MLDVFGHEPNFPQFLARAGYVNVAYARGPYKRCWGIPPERLNFPVEYWWVAPDGSRVLARLLEPHSYGLGSSLRQYEGPEEAWWHTADLFELSAAYCAAHVQIWTVGGDFAPPIPWLGELVRKWNQRHLSPRLELSTPQRFFDDLRSAIDAGVVLREELPRPPVAHEDLVRDEQDVQARAQLAQRREERRRVHQHPRRALHQRLDDDRGDLVRGPLQDLLRALERPLVPFASAALGGFPKEDAAMLSIAHAGGGELILVHLKDGLDAPLQCCLQAGQEAFVPRLALPLGVKLHEEDIARIPHKEAHAVFDLGLFLWWDALSFLFTFHPLSAGAV